jgi:hypothetical protein
MAGMNSVSLVGLLAAVVMIGCSSSVTTGTGGDGGNGGNGGSGGGSGGSGGHGGAACAGFEDEQGTGAVTFHIRNQTQQPLFLIGNCGSTPQYDLAQAGGGEDATSWSTQGGACLQTCEELQTEGPIACDACAPSVIRLEAGKTIDVSWNGTGLRPGYMMPAACYAFPGFDSCSRIVGAPAGTWIATASAFTECSSETCTCQPDGTCWGSPSGFMASATPATFSFPSATSVDIVFDTCAVGCP